MSVLVDVQNLYKRTERRVIFKEVNLTIRSGECLMLTGPSGSGKSTLLRCLVGLEGRDAGHIYWHGEEVGPENVREFRRHVVYVGQRPVDVAGTVEENLAFGRRMAASLGEREGMSRDEQVALARRFGLDEIEWSRDFDALSVGEQQRFALVRCLTLRPDVLLLDEPTASLDDASARRVEAWICDYLAEASDRRALVWVSHSSAQLERIDGTIIKVNELGA